MSERVKRFRDELKTLIRDGSHLAYAMQFHSYGDAFKDQLRRDKKSEEEIQRFIENLPNFFREYQVWYTKAQAVIKQVLPDRLADFISFYELSTARRKAEKNNYVIRDFLQEVRIAENRHVSADIASVNLKFQQQINIVGAAKDCLDSTLMDLTAILHADFFDTEVEGASALAKAGHFRAAGVICGVVIEKHLQHVCSVHNITVKKKNPGISDFLELLKREGVVTQPQWRNLQRLADIRNICGHAKGPEPTRDEIDDMVSETDKVLKTVY